MASSVMDGSSDMMSWNFDNSYARLPARFYSKAVPSVVDEPKLVILNDDLAKSLGLTFSVKDRQTAELFAGNRLPPGAEPLAQAYAGHQFGHFTRLGDGRAHLLGEHITPKGQRYDVQLKGSGRTPYSRGGDGRAALAPMLREYIISEALHGLGIPTTRSLAVVTTGEVVVRDQALAGAVLTRIAASHIRVGTFEVLAANDDRDGLRLLADYAIERHFPELRGSPWPYRSFLHSVLNKQAALIAHWMGVGFIHGVMNTDNMTISGETIDFGPCAFMNIYDPLTTFSSIDRQGRYAFGNQPHIAQWNLARFAEALLPLLDEDLDEAVLFAEATIKSFSGLFQEEWLKTMRKKIGLFGEEPGDAGLIDGLLEWMQHTSADYTLAFRRLTAANPLEEGIFQGGGFASWHSRWISRLERNSKPRQSSECLMRAHNPSRIPRNHLVEEALQSAVDGDMTVMRRLLSALKKPFVDAPEFVDLEALPLPTNEPYQTFCGT